MKQEKVYEVEFMTYTNCMRDTVSTRTGDHTKDKYLHVGKESFLATESQLDELKQYGDGYRIIRFVGNLFTEL